LIAETNVPHWLQPPQLHRPLATDSQYTEWTWEHILERISCGETLASICRDENMPDEGRFRRWVFADPQRKQRYYDARLIGADKIEDSMLAIADAEDDPMEDVQRSKLRIDSRKWLLGVWNRKRYAETKQIDVTHNVDISDAMREAEERVLARQQEKVIEHEG